MQTSESALAAAKSHPDRLIAFCCLDARVSTTNPSRYGHVAGVRGMIEILDRYKQAGARGFILYFMAPFDHETIERVATEVRPKLEEAIA